MEWRSSKEEDLVRGNLQQFHVPPILFDGQMVGVLKDGLKNPTVIGPEAREDNSEFVRLFDQLHSEYRVG